MNILVIHAHTANRGDEAAVKAMVDELLMKYPNAKITIALNGVTPYPNMPQQVELIDRFPKVHNYSSNGICSGTFNRRKMCLYKSGKEIYECTKIC